MTVLLIAFAVLVLLAVSIPHTRPTPSLLRGTLLRLKRQQYTGQSHACWTVIEGHPSSVRLGEVRNGVKVLP